MPKKATTAKTPKQPRAAKAPKVASVVGIVKSRFFYLDQKVNPGKLKKLEELHSVYIEYLGICVSEMIRVGVLKGKLSKIRSIFPKSEKLTSQIAKNAQCHAIDIVTSWATKKYNQKLKQHIMSLYKKEEISEKEAHQLFSIGKYKLTTPSKKTPKKAITAYLNMLRDPEISGKVPTVSINMEMRMSSMTCELEAPEKTCLSDPVGSHVFSGALPKT